MGKRSLCGGAKVVCPEASMEVSRELYILHKENSVELSGDEYSSERLLKEGTGTYAALSRSTSKLHRIC